MRRPTRTGFYACETSFCAFTAHTTLNQTGFVSRFRVISAAKALVDTFISMQDAWSQTYYKRRSQLAVNASESINRLICQYQMTTF